MFEKNIFCSNVSNNLNLIFNFDIKFFTNDSFSIGISFNFALNATILYRAPLSSIFQFNSDANFLEIEPFPELLGPSIVIIGID